MDKTSMMLGWLVGRQIAGQRRTQEKQPIAYLYNGVQLPPLPEWDRKAYPYAVMYGVKMSDGTWKTQGILEMYAEQPKVYSDDSGKTLCGVPNGCKAMYWGVCEPGTEYNSEWKTEANAVYENYTGRSISFYKVLWTNFDLLNEDGSVYLAASDPIPVYE